MQPRAIHFVSAVLVGLGIGVFVYRFAILGFFWGQDGAARWIFPAVGAGLVAAGFKIQSLDTQSERPAVATRIVFALLGIGAAMGLLVLLVPPLDKIRLERREVAGFSFELPTAKPDTETVDYNTGGLTWKKVGGANAVLSVTWQVGTTSKADLEVAMQALSNELGSGSAPTTTQMDGPGQTKVDTMLFDTDKGAPLRMSMLPCGTRAVLVMSIGSSGIESVHGRILKSFQCTPDATKENPTPGVVRVAVSLPGWTVSEKQLGQLTLQSEDAQAILIMREVGASQTKLEEIIVPLLNAFGGKVEKKPMIGDRVPFVGSIEGEPIEGWARRVSCPTHGVLVLAIANTHEASEAAYTASSNAGCLRPGEVPPTWPDAPVGAPVDAPADPAAGSATE